jgi:hypothetical protein
VRPGTRRRTTTILVFLPLGFIFFKAPSMCCDAKHECHESHDWRRVPVTPDILAVALELIALSAVVVALAVEVFGKQRLGWIPFIVGTSGLGFGIFGLIRLYRQYAWQQGFVGRGEVRSFLLCPYGLLALAFALIMTLTLFAIGLLAIDATL